MIDAPVWLLLLPLVLVLSAAIARRGLRASAAVRGLVLSLLVVGLAGPRLAGPTLGPVHVLVVDRSDSAARLQPPDLAAWVDSLPDDATVAVVSFAQGAELSVSPTPVHALPPAQDWPALGLPADASALGAALSLAAHTIPEGRSGAVHVLSDGHSTDATAPALALLTARGLALTATPLEKADAAPAALQALDLPPQVSAGATVDAEVQVWGGHAGLTQELVVRAQVESGSVELARRQVEAVAGTSSTVRLPLSFPPDLPAGVRAITVEFGEDSLHDGILIDRPPEVLVVYGDRRDGAFLSGVLEADGLRVRRVPASEASLEPAPDLVVLAGPSAASLPEGFLTELSPFVDGGGGLLTVAGPGAYAAGRWQDSALAPLLPVRIDPDGAEKDDTAALLVVLDKSGSMARPAADSKSATGMISGVADVMIGGRSEGSKIRVAAEAAAATMSKLRDHDRIGVLAVDTLPYWALKMSPAAERERGADQIRRISAGGGGMYVLTALEAAATAMRAEEAPLRHILLLVDASDAGEQTRDVFGDVRGAVRTAKALRSEGITISIVGIGSSESRDSAFLADLARSGGGRLKLTPDIRTVSALFTQEVERLVGSAVSEAAPVRVVVGGWHPALRGVDIGRAPTIWGWSETRPRPEARHVLTTPEGAPVLSVWRRGLGQVAALTTDDGARWARGWPRWSDSARFYTQLARDLARDRAGQQDVLRFVGSPAGPTIEVHHQNNLQQPILTEGRTLTMQVDGSQAAAPALTLSGVGHQTGRVEAPVGSEVVVTLNSTDGTAIATAAGIVPSPAEHAHRGIDTDTLQALHRSAGPHPPTRAPGRPLWPVLVALALLLLPLDAWARRRGA